MLAVPEARLAVGVKTAVRVVPLPLIAPSVPPVVVMSLSVNPVGASLKLKVTVAVSPDLTVETPLVMDNVGASVSMLIDGVVPAPPALPAVSV
jgi:hypothetical protein